MPTSGLLDRLGADLDTVGVPWHVRGEDASTVTVRVGAGSPRSVADVLERHGFARPRPGAAYVAPDATGRWVHVEPADDRRSGSRRARFRRPARRGLTVALLGPDGVGKSTLVAGLTASYPLPVRTVYMGMWQGAGRPGYTRVDAVVAILVRPLRVWWRVAVGAVHAARGRVVVFDRYTYDALLPVTGSLRRLKRPYFWFLAHLAPRPDLVLVLDLPGAVAFARKGEFTPEGLEAVRQGFLALAPRVGADVVDASAPAEQVRADVTARIWQHHRRRLVR